MSAKLVVVDGDQMQFDPMFGNRKVTPIGPARIVGSGHATVGKKKMCVAGDEKRVRVQAQYQIPGYSPGMGIITIAMLGGDQQMPRIKGRPALIVKGSQFTARFTPTQPAIMSSTPNTPDPTVPSMGSGRFIPSQIFVKAG